MPATIDTEIKEDYTRLVTLERDVKTLLLEIKNLKRRLKDIEAKESLE